MYDLVIIGAGPAGLSAAIYAARAELSFVVLEKGMPGGQIVNTEMIDNYPGFMHVSGYDLMERFRANCEELGAEFLTECVQSYEKLHQTDSPAATGTDEKALHDSPAATGTDEKALHDSPAATGTDEKALHDSPAAMGPIDAEPLADGFCIHTESGKQYYTRTILIATGTSPEKLMVPGEERFFGAGISYCAACDGAFYRGKDVFVIGGGNTAVTDAIVLSKFCRRVTLVHRRNQLRAEHTLCSALSRLENVTIRYERTVKEIRGTEHVEGIVLESTVDGREETFSCDGIFAAIGSTPNNLHWQEFIACDARGYLTAGENCETSVPGIFAAGDVRTKPFRQVVTAAADGACAVHQIQRYLTERVGKTAKGRQESNK